MSITRRVIAAAITAACTGAALAQVQTPMLSRALPMLPIGTPGTAQRNVASEAPQILWIRNDRTGQVIKPGTTKPAARAADGAPITVYNNFDQPNGVAGINLNWNYPGAYTDSQFSPPPEGDPLRFGVINISSDPTDPDDYFETIGGEKVSLIFEPYTATNWPVADPNARLPASSYSSVIWSYSEQFEIRVCRIYFFSLADVTLPFDADTNPYALEMQLSFAFASRPFMNVQTDFAFDLTGFDPPLAIKSKGLILTHWLQLTVPVPCPADLNSDTIVDDADFSVFVVQYDELDCAAETMPNNCSADLNADGFVDDADFVQFLFAYNDVLCPQPTVVRKVFAPLAGGRFRWDTGNLPSDNPLSKAVESPGWPFPTSLLTVPGPLASGPYPDYPELRCSEFGCEPSFTMYFSTLTAFHNLDGAPLQADLPADELEAEYERFLNAAAAAPTGLQQFAIYNVRSFIDGGLENTDWVPMSTPKRLDIEPLPPSNARR